MKKKYLTPKIRIVKLKSESLMIQFSLREGEDDGGGGAGAKRQTYIIIDDETEEDY